MLATEVIKKCDLRAEGPVMVAAKRNKFQEFLIRKTFKVVGKEDIPTDANALIGHFVLAIKSNEKVVKFLALYVIGGCQDLMKNLIVYKSQIFILLL